MAKAKFHKNQRVFVPSVGTWAVIETIIPHWAKGVGEPLKVMYEVGLGREFEDHELQAEELAATGDLLDSGEQWRLMRGVNKWKSVEECAHHPHPGTHPVVTTGEVDWGGWRVPGAEYDLDPGRIEAQARIITHSLHCVTMLRKLSDYAEDQPENFSGELMEMVHDARKILQAIAT